MNITIGENLTNETCHEFNTFREELKRLCEKTRVKMVGDDVHPPTSESSITTALLNIVNVNAKIHDEVERLRIVTNTLHQVSSPNIAVFHQLNQESMQLVFRYEDRLGFIQDPSIKIYYYDVYSGVTFAILDNLPPKDFAFMILDEVTKKYYRQWQSKSMFYDSLSEFTCNTLWILKSIEVEINSRSYVKIWDKSW